jgi:hypothetical protein
VAALKQFGLVEDDASGNERKVRISDLARRILADVRPGVREQAVRKPLNGPRSSLSTCPGGFLNAPTTLTALASYNSTEGLAGPLPSCF